MVLNPPTNLEKAAILLRRLSPPSLSKVFEILGPETSEILRKAMDAVGSRTDLAELDELVMQEFREMQQEVRESLRGSPELERLQDVARYAQGGATSGVPGYHDLQADETTSEDDNSETSASDVMEQLTSTPPAVVAAALQRETLRTTALVLRELPMEFTGRVLEKLPPEQRQQIFMMLAAKSSIHPAVTQRVLKAVADVCSTMDESSLEEQDSRFKTLIGILQMVEREERLRLMEALMEQDEELATQIDDNLYDYADIMRIQDRSVQKLLTQLELKVVALALKTAPADLVEKVMKNLSERVRATLTEEMELISSLSPSKVEQARREIANVIRTQDKDGTLQWIE